MITMNEVYPYMESSIPIWNVVSLYNVDVRTMRRIVQPREPEASEDAVQTKPSEKGSETPIVSTAQSF